jgi:hypothetical protein
MRKRSTVSRWLLATRTICLCAALNGCSLIPIDPHGTKFAEWRNAEVGKRIEQSWFRLNPKRSLGNGKNEYTAKDRYSGCQWAYEVDESTGIVLGWRYISDPSLCKAEISQSW